LSMLVVVVVSGCSRHDAAWEQAKTIDTADAYADYQEQHPRSRYSTAARLRREALLAERDWSSAKQANTTESYQRYIEKHPEGLWVQLAQARVAQLEAVAAPVDVAEEPAATLELAVAPAEPSAAATVGSASLDAPAAAPPATQVFVQLGAFSSQAAAERAWGNATRSVAALASLQPTIARSSRSSSLYLLRVGVADLAAARELCAAAARAGQACIVDPS
jgi:cell division protein FtsN